MDDDQDGCCPGSTIDVTVGEASAQLHTHALMTPELLDTMLARMTKWATWADTARTKGQHIIFGPEDA